MYKEGDKVFFRGKVYDFGYIGATGRAIIYEEGERNMQDMWSVDLNELSPVRSELELLLDAFLEHVGFGSDQTPNSEFRPWVSVDRQKIFNKEVIGLLERIYATTHRTT